MKMKLLNFFATISVFSIMLTSCGSLINSPFAKRKYTSGIFVNKKEIRENTPKEAVSTNLTQNKSNEDINRKNEYALVLKNKEIIPSSNELKKDIALKSPKENKKLKSEHKQFHFHFNSILKLNKGAQANAPYEQKQIINTTEQDNTLLLIKIIIAIFIPPLAVFIHEKATTDFWIDLILWLFFGVGRVLPFFFGFWGVAFIYALFVILGLINLG
jgi:uncharacterized membrane protein YqaE (UPF0057 family)